MSEAIVDNWLGDADRGWLLSLAGATEVDWPDVRRRAAEQIGAVTSRLMAEVCDPRPGQPELPPTYVRRVCDCLSYHAAPGRFVSLTSLIETAETGGLVPGGRSMNLLLDVTTAEAMEKRHNRAAQRFEQEFMPQVRGMAWRMGGREAVSAVENFTAELIMLRENGVPRIRNYQGRTTLICWLRAVVANFVVSRSRKSQPLTGVDLPDPCTLGDAATHDGRDCESLLGPLFRRVVADTPPESRLLLTLLLVDQVPQRQVAASLGIDSGNVTRRRQRAADDILQRLGRGAAQLDRNRRVEDCLELLLSGDDRESAQRLGGILAEALASDRSATAGGTP